MALPALAGAAPATGVDAWSAMQLLPDEASVSNPQRGFAVAMEGFRAAVGARFDGPAGAGRVYLFLWDGTTWAPEAILDGAVPNGQFGISVALHGDTLAVGAVGEERDGQLPKGTAHLFVRCAVDDREVWREMPGVVGRRPGARQVGLAVALDENWLAVAGAVDMADGEHGGVLVYPLTPSQGIVTDSAGELLTRVDDQPGDRFGESLAMAAGVLVVGAPAHGDGALPAAGAAYVYQPALPPAASLMPVVTLRAPDAVADGNFGSSVAVSSAGDTLAVGAAGAPWPFATTSIGPGAAYVFSSSAGSWTQQARLAPSPTPAGSGGRFGQAVALDGALLLVGAPQYGHDDRMTASGSAFLFLRDRAGSWAELPGATVPPAAPANALYGFAVALSQNTFLVGAPLASGRAGAAFAFFPETLGPPARFFAARAATAVQPTTTAPPIAACSAAATVSFAGLPVPP